MSLQANTGNCKQISFVNLGITFTKSLSFEQHFQDKGSAVKLAIYTIWANLIRSNKVPLNVKVMCHNAIVRSIL